MAQIAWEYYLEKIQKVIDKYKPQNILKTDADNEAFNHPRSGGIVLNIKGRCKFKQIEYSEKIIKKAKNKFPKLDIDKGDIRNLPYRKNQFDMVIDLSTLDHVKASDVPKVLEEYGQVIKNNGLLFLVVWCARKKKDVILGKKWNPKSQYIFWYKDIKKQLLKFGRILEEHDVWTVNNRYQTTKKGVYILKYVLVKIKKK